MYAIRSYYGLVRVVVGEKAPRNGHRGFGFFNGSRGVRDIPEPRKLGFHDGQLFLDGGQLMVKNDMSWGISHGFKTWLIKGAFFVITSYSIHYTKLYEGALV